MVNSVVFDNTVQSYIEKVLCLFQQDMQSDRFNHVLQPPTRAKMSNDEETFPVQQRLCYCQSFSFGHLLNISSCN